MTRKGYAIFKKMTGGLKNGIKKLVKFQMSKYRRVMSHDTEE